MRITSWWLAAESVTAMTKTKRQLRAEAVERLERLERRGESYFPTDVLHAVTPPKEAGIDVLIDLLTDDEPPEGDAVALLRTYATAEQSHQDPEHVMLERGVFDRLADMVERDYVRRADFEAQHRTLCAVREQRDEWKSKASNLADQAKHFQTKCAKLETRCDEWQHAEENYQDALQDIRAERDEWKAKAEGQSNLEWMFENDAYFRVACMMMAHMCYGDDCEAFGEHATAYGWLLSEHVDETVYQSEFTNCGHPYREGSAVLDSGVIRPICFVDVHSKAQSRTEPKLSELFGIWSGANDDSAPENDVTAEGDGANDGNANLGTDRGTSEPTSEPTSENLGKSQDSEIDTREKLEADVRKYLDLPANCRGWGDYKAVCAWLDRQAAIIERQYKENYTGLGLLHDLNEYGISVKYLPSERRFTFDCSGCEWPSLAAQPDQEAYDRIAELEAKVDELAADLEAVYAMNRSLRLRISKEEPWR